MIRHTTTRIGARRGRRAGIVLGIGSLLALSVGTGTLHAQAATTATTTTLTGAPNPSTGGASVVLTVAIAPVGTATVVPTGTVVFKDGTTTLGTSPVTAGTPAPDGTATLTTAFMAAATHPVTAAYSGDAAYNPSPGSMSQVVTVGPAFQIVVTASPASIPAAQTATKSTLTATVEDAGGNAVHTAGTLLNFATSNGALTTATASTNASGVATDQLTASTSALGATDTVTVSRTTLTSGTAMVSEVGTTTNFVNDAYMTMLGHAADPSGLSYWVAQLNAGLPRPSFAGALASTSEYRNNVISGTGGTSDFYHLYLNRAFDAAGGTYWVGQMAKGMTFEQVRLQFVGSPEFYTITSGGNRTTAIHNLYVDLLGRTPQASETTYWLANYDQSILANEVLFSSEGRSFLVNTLYTHILSRTAVGDPGAATWANALLNGASDENIIASILGSVEYYNAHH